MTSKLAEELNSIGSVNLDDMTATDATNGPVRCSTCIHRMVCLIHLNMVRMITQLSSDLPIIDEGAIGNIDQIALHCTMYVYAPPTAEETEGEQ